MADAPRIRVEELKRRMDAGKDFTVVDLRNPTFGRKRTHLVSQAKSLLKIPLDADLG
jgi:hypothetical protein